MKRLYIMIAAVAAMLFPQTSLGGVNFPIDITFAARGEATAVGEVTVTNLSDPSIAPVTLSGTDILRLVDPSSMPTAIESIAVAEGVTRPILTPNPSMGDGTLIFDAREAGPVRISIYTTDGKLLESATLQVEKGRNTALIPSQSSGIYLINIEGKGLKSTARWICCGGKSGSHIALGGAAQWANVSLPFAAPWQQGVQTRLQSQANAEGTNVVRMNFHEGDILRFDGTSDGMRTIMHLSPESTHDVFFDFFRCQDVDGYNYPIVRSGDMLWMMEDLHPLKVSGVVKTDNATIWKGVDELAAAEFVIGDRAYYTVAGARLALPEGWEMPSIDEIYAFVKELNANTETLGDFMKDRDFDWPLELTEGLDTIHMQLRANGYVDREGQLVDDGLIGAWATRTTVDRGHAVSFEINATTSQLSPLVKHGRGFGFSIRGCRPAPSVYQEMLQQAFNSGAEAASAPRKMPMQLVNSNGPLGSYYTYGADRSSVFFDYSGQQWGGDAPPEQRSGMLYKPEAENAWIFTNKCFVNADVNGADIIRHLRKVTAQGNASDYENVVYASWSKPFRVFTDGTTKGKVAEVAAVMGQGVVNVTIYGDSTKNNAIIDGYDSRPLLDAQGNEYQWAMPTFNNGKLSRKMYGVNGDYMSDIRSEYFARAFNLRCIQDLTGDGVEEIVMNVANKIAVFDGVSLRCLHERIFEDKGSYIGVPNLRYDVADVNGDGYDDIVLLLNCMEGEGNLLVYSQGNIDEEPIFTRTIPSSCLFCDVKVGIMSGHDLPEIAVLTRGMESGRNDLLTQKGYLYVYRLGYDANLQLTETSCLPQTVVDCFSTSDSNVRPHLGNMDLVFGYFRGRSYNQDLIVGDGLWRWDDAQMKPVFKFVVLESTKINSRTIPADAIAAVQASKADGKEVLSFIWSRQLGKNDGFCRTFSELGEMWLSEDGNSSTLRLDFNSVYFGWGTNGQLWEGNKNLELTKTMLTNISDGNERNSHPVLCKFADRAQSKHFRFISHEVTFSEPRIYAAIAAAPYYEGLDGSDGAESVWGKTTSDGHSTAQSDSWGGSIIAGYEYDYSIPFIAKGGIEFTTTVSASAGIATEHEVTSYGQEYAAGKDHVVVMHATPHDTYRYEIIASDNPDEIGMEFVVSMPRTRRFVGLKLEDYVRLMGSQKGVSKPQRYLTATPGVPLSYPPLYDKNSSIYFVNDDHPFLMGKDLNGGSTFEMVGTGGSTTRSISLATSDSRTTSVEIGVEMELVATVNGVKAGVGFNYNHTNENTHTIGKEFAVSGTVPGLPSLNDPEHPQFNWNIVWYYVKDEGGVYPVINYAVTEK